MSINALEAFGAIQHFEVSGSFPARVNSLLWLRREQVRMARVGSTRGGSRDG